MRADRLVAIVLLLQAHSQMSAGQLADELEVSERTIRRDLDALLMAGVPLYSQRGRNGGWALLDGHKMNLSGMTAAEAEALLLVAGPQGLTDLGVAEGLKSALRKLVAALPEPTRVQALKASTALHVDPSRWGAEPESSPLLADLRHAVVNGFQVDIEYTKPGSQPARRRVHPYGLVIKNGVWYLLGGSEAGTRTFRVSRISEVVLSDAAVERPEDFVLEQAWGAVRDRMQERLPPLEVTFRVEAGAERWVQIGMAWFSGVEPIGPDPGAADGSGVYRAQFRDAASAAGELARFGNRVSVIEPPEVRTELVRLANELLATNPAEAPA